MSAVTPEMRELFRRCLLETASARERARVEQWLADDPSLRAALEDERLRLAVLDGLPDQAPSRDLVAEVSRQMGRVEPAPRKPIWKSAVPYAAVAGLVAVVLVLLPVLSRQRETALRASIQDNMKQIGLALKMYASESKGGMYPPRAPYDGVWMMDLRYLYPEFISDLSLFVNPRNPDADAIAKAMAALVAQEPVDWEAVTRLAAQSYVYPGWLIRDAEDLPVFLRGVRQLAKADYGDDIRVGDTSFPRHREGIERFLITDINNPASSVAAQSRVPILFERVESDDGRGGMNVLYMDGLVEFVPLGSKFPAVDEALESFPAPPVDLP